MLLNMTHSENHEEGDKKDGEDNMTEDTKQKEIRLKKELAKVRAQNADDMRKTTKNRDFSVGGLPPDTTHKATLASNDVPDVILPPQRRRGKKENIPF